MIKDLRLNYRSKLKPYKHQSDIFELTKDRHYYGLWWEMGTGKSKPLIDTFTHLFLKGEIDGVLIISDKGAYLNWPDREIPKHLIEELPTRVAHWSSYMLKDDVRRLDKLMVAQDDMLDVLCMNVESFSSDRAASVAEKFVKAHYTMMIVDESSSIKNPGAARTKAILKLGKMCDYRRIANGTPMTNSPMDLFSQCEFLCPGSLGFRSFVAFRSYYAVMRTMVLGRRSFQKICGYQNLDELTRSMQSFSSRILKDEYMDLPPKTYEIIDVEHTPEQARAYEQLKSMAILQLDQGLLTSTAAITTINKLHQINCGHVKLDDGTCVDIPNNRISALIDLVEKLDGRKLIIWCNFQRDVELISLALSQYAGDSGQYGVRYYGPIDPAGRKSALDKFEHDDNCKWFTGTAATGGKGIDGLQVAHHVAYYSNSYNLEDRLQSEDRAHRNGQTKPVTYYDFIVPRTVDTKILDSLKAKKDLSFQVLDKIREILS